MASTDYALPFAGRERVSQGRVAPRDSVLYDNEITHLLREFAFIFTLEDTPEGSETAEDGAQSRQESTAVVQTNLESSDRDLGGGTTLPLVMKEPPSETATLQKPLEDALPVPKLPSSNHTARDGYPFDRATKSPKQILNASPAVPSLPATAPIYPVHTAPTSGVSRGDDSCPTGFYYQKSEKPCSSEPAKICSQCPVSSKPSTPTQSSLKSFRQHSRGWISALKAFLKPGSDRRSSTRNGEKTPSVGSQDGEQNAPEMSLSPNTCSHMQSSLAKQLPSSDGPVTKFEQPHTPQEAKSSKTVSLHDDDRFNSSTASDKTKVEERTSTSLCSSSDYIIERSERDSTCEEAPLPFRCTFCFSQCQNRTEWSKHEDTHIPHQGWTCMLCPIQEIEAQTFRPFAGTVVRNRDMLPHNIDACVDAQIEDRTFPHRQDFDRHLSLVHHHRKGAIGRMRSWRWPRILDEFIWECGFCDELLQTWEDRSRHIAEEHFEKGVTIAVWSPLRSPYPLWRRLLTPVTGFPFWDAAALLSLQKSSVWDSSQGATPLSRQDKTQIQPQCRHCKIIFTEFDTSLQHMELWHSHPESWQCPDLTDPSNSAITFGPISEDFSAADDNVNDIDETIEICFCCGKPFSNDPPNWNKRLRHLVKFHHFDLCPLDQKFFRKEHFVIHMANTHNVPFEYMRDVVELYKAREGPPALGIDEANDSAARDTQGGTVKSDKPPGERRWRKGVGYDVC